MAFSRGEDRELQPVSVSHTSSTPPTSPPAYLSPRAEHAFVDAEDVERWLTSPAMAGSTDDLGFPVSNEKNSSPRLRLKDVTDRRRYQQIQEQNQPPLPQSPEQDTSLRHRKLMKEWQEKEQRQLAQQRQSPRRNFVAPSVGSRKKREEFRRTAKMTIAEMEKGSRNSHSEKPAVTDSKIHSSSSDKAKDGEKNSSQSKDTEDMHERLDTKLTRREKGIAAIRRRRELRLRQLEEGPNLIEKKELKKTDNTQSKDNENDEPVFSVSPNKKIHLLKRHDAGKARSPLVREVSNNGSSAIQDDATNGTIYTNEKPVSTVAKVRMIRRQMADGNNRRSHSPQKEPRPLLANMDGSIVPLHEPQQKQPQILLQTHSEGSDESERTIAEGQDQSKVDSEVKVQGNVKTKAANIDNANSTLRIKDALARSRSYRRTIKRQSNQRKHGDESYGERALRNHFQSSSIPCPSVMTVGSSTIDCKSNGSQTENGSDDETSVITNNSEETDEGVSQLTSSSEREATANKNIPSILESQDSAISSNIDDASLAHDSTDSSFHNFIDELMEEFGGAIDETEEDLKRASQIKLHVYDLVATNTQLDLWGYHFPVGQVFNALNSSLHSIGTGAYHVGLEVNGVEYAYGANPTKGLTGIFRCKPKHSPGYQYRTSIDFGNRVVKKQLSEPNPEFKAVVDGQIIIREMVNEYLGTDYDLLRKNCCTFAHDACLRLGIKEDEIPTWFHNLAAVGAITQDAANYTLAPITQLFGVNELDEEQFDEISDCPEESASDEQPLAVEVALVEEKKDNYVADTAYEY